MEKIFQAVEKEFYSAAAAANAETFRESRRVINFAEISEGDKIAGRELALYAENECDLYEMYLAPCLNCLQRHYNRGDLDESKAPKIFTEFLRAAAKRYTATFAESGADWRQLFPVPAREYAAREYFLAHFLVDAESNKKSGFTY